MSENWRKWLVALGLAIAGAVVALFRLSDGTPPAVRVILSNCPEVDLACEARVSGELLEALGGADGGRGSRYRRLLVNARDCRDTYDAGIIITDRALYADGGWRPGVEVVSTHCRVIGDAGVQADLARQTLGACACRAAAGLCRVQLEDGGMGPAPFGATLGPGYEYAEFNGAGCVRKACVEIAGESSWPDTCPGGP